MKPWGGLGIHQFVRSFQSLYSRMLRPNLLRPCISSLSPSAALILRTRATNTFQLRAISRIALIKKNKEKIRAQIPAWKPPFPGWKPDPETEVSKHKNVHIIFASPQILLKNDFFIVLHLESPLTLWMFTSFLHRSGKRQKIMAFSLMFCLSLSHPTSFSR